MTTEALRDATETAVLVLVPEADRAVAEHRARLDTSASWGVPAHVSVVYPFAPPAQVDDDVLARLADAIGGVPAFDCAFPRSAWFGDDVVWLAPEPADPFRRLTGAVVAAFPAHQPYGGIHDDVVPHLTVGELRRGSTTELQAAERAIAAPADPRPSGSSRAPRGPARAGLLAGGGGVRPRTLELRGTRLCASSTTSGRQRTARTPGTPGTSTG